MEGPDGLEAGAGGGSRHRRRASQALLQRAGRLRRRPRDPGRRPHARRPADPPGSACSIAVGAGLVDTSPGTVQGLQLVVPDVQAARAQLAQRGVEVSQVQHYEGADLVDGPGDRWNSFVFFRDPDGNGWAVQERPAG